jgi:hypothetical protein
MDLESGFGFREWVANVSSQQGASETIAAISDHARGDTDGTPEPCIRRLLFAQASGADHTVYSACEQGSFALLLKN